MLKLIKKIIIIVLLALILVLSYSGVKIYQNVQQVLIYKPQVQQATENYDIMEYENLVYAIIYTETKGRSIDLMQSSESKYGERQMIDTPEESIEIGVSFLAESLNKAQQEGCDIWTAVQAYNFGLDYIDYVKKNGGKNTVLLAEKYSREILSPLLGNDNEQMYRYYRPQALFHNGGFLYTNGGNMFYADIVKMNQKFIQLSN